MHGAEGPTKRAEVVLLVADDDQAVLDAMRFLLESKGGLRVYCVAGAAGANTFFAGHQHVDVIITDVILAGKITGIDICLQGRALHPDVGVVVISADPEIDSQSIPERSVYLHKSFGGNELMAAIEQAKILAD